MTSETIFQAIQNNSIEKLSYYVSDINSRDSMGRTPLIYAIVHKKSIDIITEIISLGSDLELTDKLGYTALLRAIAHKNIECIKLLLKNGSKIQSENIVKTPWYAARHTPKIADLFLETHGSIRLTLDTYEEKLLKNILYNEDTAIVCEKIRKLNSSEILHAFAVAFNYDDNFAPLLEVINHKDCKEITVIEIIELLSDGDTPLVIESIDKRIFDLIKIKYPHLLYLCEIE